MTKMVYYKDNPSIKELQVVTTFDNKKEYRKNCKFIKQLYYTINHDCFEIENKWYRKNSNSIVYDWEKRTYILKNQMLLNYGLIKNDNNELELGYFSSNPYKNIYTTSKKYGTVQAISEEILDKHWLEDRKHNIFFDSSEYSNSDTVKRLAIGNSENPASRGYNIEDNDRDFKNKVIYYNNYPTVITPKIKKLSKYVGNLSFGFEFESSLGSLPIHLQNRYGVVPCRDGSLNGGMELVTIPMTGAKGMQTIVYLCKELSKRTVLGLDCSLHIHFSNFGTDKLSIISLYRLCRIIQEELFSMFPYYKTEPNGIKQKNYTKKLQKLNIGILVDDTKDAYEAYLLDSWNKLFNFYSEKTITIDEFNKKTREHPISNKWSRNSRYYYFNFMNMFFTHRHTVEARLSGPTTNVDKTLNWFLICVAIIKYSQRYAKDIIKNEKTISLKEVLNIFSDTNSNSEESVFLSKYLYNYFLERKEKFRKDYSRGDYASLWDIEEDHSYKYTYLDTNLLE